MSFFSRLPLTQRAPQGGQGAVLLDEQRGDVDRNSDNGMAAGITNKQKTITANTGTASGGATMLATSLNHITEGPKGCRREVELNNHPINYDSYQLSFSLSPQLKLL